MEIIECLPPEDLAELDRVCRYRRVGRAEAVHEAVRWYIGREGELPPVDAAADDFDP